MRISMRTDYGLRAMLDLAQQYGRGPIASADIAARQNIPQPYLDQLLIALRTAGFVRSARGPQGGHILATPPDEIKVSDVVTALEGCLSLAVCVEEADTCSIASDCALRGIWRKVFDATVSVLSSVSIGDLARTHRRKAADGMYYI